VASAGIRKTPACRYEVWWQLDASQGSRWPVPASRENFLFISQGRPCGRPPAALRPGNDTTVTGAPASPSSKAVGSYQVSGTSLQLYARMDAPKSYVERA
jgi:hypothetical protein